MTENDAADASLEDRTRDEPGEEPAEAGLSGGSSDDPELVDALRDRVELLESDLEEARSEVEETADRLQRLQARFQNFRRRKEREAEQAEQRGREAVLTEVLDVVDDFERALDNAGTDAGGAREGLELLYKQLRRLLEREGVERMEPHGEVFDPALHEAVLREETGDHPEGTVVQVLQPGYAREGSVLRPARVKVASAPAGEDGG